MMKDLINHLLIVITIIIGIVVYILFFNYNTYNICGHSYSVRSNYDYILRQPKYIFSFDHQCDDCFGDMYYLKGVVKRYSISGSYKRVFILCSECDGDLFLEESKSIINKHYKNRYCN